MDLITNDILCQKVTKFIQDHIDASFLTDTIKHQFAESYKSLTRENAAVTLEFVTTIYERAVYEAKIVSDARLLQYSGTMIATGLIIGTTSVLIQKYVDNRKTNTHQRLECIGGVGGFLFLLGTFGGFAGLMSMANVQF
jgi:hypothetical protein